MGDPIRVRFAPSPTGHLHIGGARTALFNYLYARNQGGVFVLRIEDTDAERSTEDSVRMILDDLRWLGLTWDEGPEQGGDYGPYFQSRRLDLYRKKWTALLETGRAYPCFCSPGELDRKREEALARGEQPRYDGTCRDLPPDAARQRVAAGEPHVVRLKLPQAGETAVDDRIRGRMIFGNDVLDDFVLVRSNGLPTYNFAAVVDDAAMRITHVIRGDDHISNTPRQIQLYHALGETPPKFTHVPMILGPDRTRLSKRHGATSIGAYANEGYLPETLVNYLALLGWAYDDKTTLFTRRQLEEKFSLKKVGKNPAVFDPAKLAWMNGVYIRQLDDEAYAEHALNALIQAGFVAADAGGEDLAWAEKVARTVKEKIKVFPEVPKQTAFFFGAGVEPDAEALAKIETMRERPGVFHALHAKLTMLESLSPRALEAALRAFVDEHGVTFGEVVHPLRAALTGKIHSPGIFEVLELLGRDRTLKRFAEALARAGVPVG